MRISTKTHRAVKLALGGAVLVVLASCGGSDNGGAVTAAPPATATTGIPSSASASVTGFIAYLKTLVVMQQNTVEPLDTTGFVAPVDNTGLPDPTI